MWDKGFSFSTAEVYNMLIIYNNKIISNIFCHLEASQLQVEPRVEYPETTYNPRNVSFDERILGCEDLISE